MSYLCPNCAPEDTESFHIGEIITGICENDSCENIDYPVDQMPCRDYRLRESCGGED